MSGADYYRETTLAEKLMRPVKFLMAAILATTVAACAATDGGPSGMPADATAAAAPSAAGPADSPAAPAVDAQPAAPLSAFIGPWAGHTEQNTEAKRAATLLIEEEASGGFSVTWASFEAGDVAGSVRQRERKMTFAATKEPGIWTAEDASTDPFAHLAGWARIIGQTLRIDILGLRRDGQLERQVYERTLQDGDMMQLTYRRFVEDELTRTIEADFMRL